MSCKYDSNDTKVLICDNGETKTYVKNISTNDSSFLFVPAFTELLDTQCNMNPNNDKSAVCIEKTDLEKSPSSKPMYISTFKKIKDYWVQDLPNVTQTFTDFSVSMNDNDVPVITWTNTK